MIHTTSGTTGRPQVVLFSPKAREVQALLVARIWRMQGLRLLVVHSVYGHGMINGGHFVREAALHYTNCLFLSAGTGKETRSVTQIELMRDLKVTVVVGFVDYIRQLAETAREMGPGARPRPADPRDLRPPWSSRARRCRAPWAVRRSATGAWRRRPQPIAPKARPDGMYVMEDAQYLEIVDEETHRPVADGQPGDMVVTRCIATTSIR
ncbi:MAG: hypothetical protein U1F18_06175 [Steroidobacteraceae bacterium]